MFDFIIDFMMDGSPFVNFDCARLDLKYFAQCFRPSLFPALTKNMVYAGHRHRKNASLGFHGSPAQTQPRPQPWPPPRPPPRSLCMVTVAAPGTGSTLIMAQKWPNCAGKIQNA